MKQRDKAIIDDLERFRCMSRDDIIELHFSEHKSKISNSNMVLKRLRRDGYIDVNMDMQPYLYFPSPTTIKKNSQKIAHYLRIVDFYKQIKRYEDPSTFTVEPKYGKEYMEPDIFMIWKRTAFFVEIQLSTYSNKMIKNKIERYEKYLYSDEWRNESWQPENKKFFPMIWFITDKQYHIDSELRVFQTRNVDDFLNQINVRA